MPPASTGVPIAFCAALAASVAAAQSPNVGGHSTAQRSPVALSGADFSGDDETPTQRPGGPPKIAQYPLENDPYERPPQFRSDPPSSPRATMQPPAAPPLTPAEEDVPWIRWDETRINGNVLHDSPDGLGITDFVVTGITKTRLPGWAINPQFGAHWFGSSSIPNIPNQTYDFSLEFTAAAPLGDDWIIAGGISPGIFSDFQGSGGDNYRFPFRIMAFYKYSETLTLGGGVLYLDRPDVNILPLVGLSYVLNDHFNMELWFPRPKVSWRYLKKGDLERWVYVVGEFGGGAWNVEMDNGTHDQFAYRDYRAMVGVEQKHKEGLSWFTEGGLIFNRQLSFADSAEKTSLDNTAAMQFGVRF